MLTSSALVPLMTVIGAALLWFGWFGFNAGSAAAARLGITPRQLAYKMHKYRIIKEFRIEG